MMLMIVLDLMIRVEFVMVPMLHKIVLEHVLVLLLKDHLLLIFHMLMEIPKKKFMR